MHHSHFQEAEADRTQQTEPAIKTPEASGSVTIDCNSSFFAATGAFSGADKLKPVCQHRRPLPRTTQGQAPKDLTGPKMAAASACSKTTTGGRGKREPRGIPGKREPGHPTQETGPPGMRLCSRVAGRHQGTQHPSNRESSGGGVVVAKLEPMAR